MTRPAPSEIRRQETHLDPAYRLEISPEDDRKLDSFPERIRNELRLRIANIIALPVTLEEGSNHLAQIEVEGYCAHLRLDAARGVVSVVELERPGRG